MAMRDVIRACLALVACLAVSACGASGADSPRAEVTPDVARSAWEPGEAGQEALIEGRLAYEAPPGAGLTIGGVAVAVPRLYEARRADDGRLVLSSPDRPDVAEGDCVRSGGGFSGDRFAVQGYLELDGRAC